MPIVHGVSPSPFVRKVRVVLAEKGVEYELVPQAPFNQPPEFMAISPLGKIPCYQDGALAIPDSSAICAYLERVHPKPQLYPSDPKHFARALWYEEYGDSKLGETVGTAFFQRVVRTRFFKQEPDEALVAEALTEKLPPVLDYLEGELSDDDALVGGRFSIADIGIATQLQQLRHAGESIDAGRWPKLARYADAILSRPSFKGCIADDVEMLRSL